MLLDFYPSERRHPTRFHRSGAERSMAMMKSMLLVSAVVFHADHHIVSESSIDSQEHAERPQ